MRYNIISQNIARAHILLIRMYRQPLSLLQYILAQPAQAALLCQNNELQLVILIINLIYEHYWKEVCNMQ